MLSTRNRLEQNIFTYLFLLYYLIMIRNRLINDFTDYYLDHKIYTQHT